MEESQEKPCAACLCSLGRQVRITLDLCVFFCFFSFNQFHVVNYCLFLMMCRCHDDGEHVDEDLFPALNDESNPVLKNKKVSRVIFACGSHSGTLCGTYQGPFPSLMRSVSVKFLFLVLMC